MNLLNHIKETRPELRKSELKVAEYVLSEPAAMHGSMADVAQAVGVSEPTIGGFACHWLPGFQT